MVRKVQVQIYRSLGTGPPPDLYPGELAFSEGDKQLYVGLSDGTAYPLRTNAPTSAAPASATSRLVGSVEHLPYSVTLTDGLYYAPDSSVWYAPVGNSLGPPSSGADVATDVVLDLYKTLWGHIQQATPPWALLDSAGNSVALGTSGQADWDAGKRLVVPDMRGRSVLAAGHGAGLSDREIGAIGGAETHSLTADENGPHSHAIARRNTGLLIDSRTTGYKNLYDPVAHGYNFNSEFSGTGEPHNNMSPWKAYTELWYCGAA